MMSLCKIQQELKAPKGQTNTFGKYKYRSCEDIVEALKPVMAKHKCYLLMKDEVIEVGGRVYVKASVTIISEDAKIIGEASAYAREPISKKGMDESQITGAASSYARKYALNGLLAIDDTKDADSNEATTQANNAPKLPKLTDDEAEDAYHKWEATKLDLLDDDGNEDAEKVMAAWQLLSSRVRTGIKAHGTALRAMNSAMNNTGENE